MNEMNLTVFISLGRSASDAHIRFVRLIYAELASRQLAPVVLDRSGWTSDDPLRAIHDLMRGCSGVMIIALPRFEYESVIEFPDSDKPIVHGARMVPTLWNQIEASLAYTMKLPLISLVDNRLYTEALLTPKHTSYNVVTFDLQACQGELPPYIGEHLSSFQDNVIKHFKRRHKTKTVART